MDKLEDFFKENKEQFDFINVDASVNDWESISEKLDGPAVAKRKSSAPLIAIAASVALMLSFALFQFKAQPPTAIKSLTGLDLGMQFPEVALQNPDGETVALSELNAHLVLVDFWASYCMVCNEENCYYFKPLYNEFKDKGFEIYAVSADSSAQSWMHAIQRDQLDWVQVSDLKGFESPIFNTFDVNSLPTNYLLDREGRIIAKNINVDELENTLYGMFVLK